MNYLGGFVLRGYRELSGSSGPLIPEVIHLRNATQEQRDDEVLFSLDCFQCSLLTIWALS